MRNFLIWCETEEEKSKVLQKMEDEGIVWYSGHLPTKCRYYYAPLALSVRTGRLGLFPFSKEEIEAEKYGKDLIKVTPDEYLLGGKKEMKKSDLKTGYLVVTRDGHEYVVYLNVLTDYQHNKKSEDIIVCNQGDNRCWDGLDVYNEDLTYKGSKAHKNDIMEVYLLYHPFALQDMSYCEQMRKLLWKREETKELTVKQIEEILGYSIKIIKE